jgi:hypothetical protein
MIGARLLKERKAYFSLRLILAAMRQRHRVEIVHCRTGFAFDPYCNGPRGGGWVEAQPSSITA